MRPSNKMQISVLEYIRSQLCFQFRFNSVQIAASQDRYQRRSDPLIKQYKSPKKQRMTWAEKSAQELELKKRLCAINDQQKTEHLPFSDGEMFRFSVFESVKLDIPLIQEPLQQDQIFQIYLAVVIEIKDGKVYLDAPLVEMPFQENKVFQIDLAVFIWIAVLI